MKTLFYLIVLILSTKVIAQTPRFLSHGKPKAATSPERLKHTRSISDISPDFWARLAIPYEMRQELEQKRLLASAQGYYVYPADNNLGKYLSITNAEISVWSKGTREKIKVGHDQMSPELKKLLASADLGTDIRVKITFRAPETKSMDSLTGKLLEAEVLIHVVPEVEAEFPGGMNSFKEYIAMNILTAFPGGKESSGLSKALVSFTIDEKGNVTNTRITRTSGMKKIDEHILDVINNMPKWEPAANEKKPVPQDFTVPFMGDGC